MLAKTANGLFWMSRYIERSENTARLLDTGLRMALTRIEPIHEEWKSVVETVGAESAFTKMHEEYSAKNVTDFLLRDKSNPSSVMNAIDNARMNARLVRTAITRDVWESINESWLKLKEVLRRPVSDSQLTTVLGIIRQQSALIRGSLHGTMLRNETYSFSRLGTFIERADNTARIIDVKYYVLLPSSSYIGSPLDSVQWESILRSVSAHRSYRWFYKTDYIPSNIAEFLILNKSMPRSLAFCYDKLNENLNVIGGKDHDRNICQEHSCRILKMLDKHDSTSIFATGLHEFLTNFIDENIELGTEISKQYRFYQ